MIREAIAAIVEGRSLSQAEAAQVMDEIMTGQATPAQLGALLIALRLKGETVEEIAGLASAMRSRAIPVYAPDSAVDTCGTGGDGAGTFNVSTTAAFVAAGAGVAVAKHGNRAMSSRCGSADVLEALGIRIDLDAAGVSRCLAEVGIGFMFAPLFHPAMKHAAGPRRELGVRTIFNVLGPLTNPAGVRRQVLGVADPTLAPRLAQALKLLGCKHALVVHGEDGLDEVSISAPSLVYEVKGDQVTAYRVAPEDFGLNRAPRGSVTGASAEENAALARKVLEGAPGPCRDIVVLNAAAALVVGGVAKDWREGITLAQRSIDSGAARRKLEELVEFSRGVSF